MLSKSNDYISISLSDDALKVAHLKGAGSNAKVVNVVTRDVTGISASDLPKVIQSAVGGMGAKKANVVCIIPPSLTTTKNIEIPSVSEDEIQSIVNLQAGRHTPFSREEIQIGYVNLGVYKNNYTKVLLVIANKNVIKNQLTAFEKAGLKIKQVLFAPEGIATFYSTALGLATEAAPTGIIDIDKQSTNFIVVFKGAPLTARSIPIGQVQLAADPGAKENLVQELAMTIESYQTEDIDQLPGNYIFSSEDDSSRAMQPLLQEKLGCTVAVSSYIDNVKSTKGVLKKLAVKSADSSLLDIIASASTSASAQVNLMPEEVLLQKSVEAQGRDVFKTAILVFISMILIVVCLELKINASNTDLKKMVEAYDGNRAKVVALEELTKKTKIVQDYLANRMISLDVINELYRNIPDEVYLTNVYMDQDGNINIQGISEIASIVFNLGTTLKESELFKSVEIKSTTSKKDRGKDATAFEITLNLNAAEEEDMADNLEE